jgi:heme exporter protein A
MASVTCLSGSDLACVRAGRLVFEKLDFAVRKGEMLAVRGANGAGKSSLLRLIAGLLRPSAGLLALDGGDEELSIGEQAHYVGHQDPLKPSLRVAENLAFWRDLFGGSGDIIGGLEELGASALAQVPALYLSAGQRRRVSLARLLLVPRPIWLLDEPNSSLDERGQMLLTRIMEEHLARGGMIVAATHGALGAAPTRELLLATKMGRVRASETIL